VDLLATIRPGEWELPLFLHVLGAMAMVGALALALIYLVPAWRGGSLDSLSLGFRTLLYAALPSFIVMRVAAQWIADEQGYTGDDVPGWVNVGFITTDAGLLFLVIALIVAGVAVRRARRAGTEPGAGSTRTATVLVSVLLVAYLVAIWAMTAKPG
jgi:hypothetical protein